VCSYQLINHTADIGVEIRAEDIEGLFTESIKALFYLLTDEDLRKIEYNKNELVRKRISFEVKEIGDALIQLINNIIFIVDTKHLIPVNLEVNLKYQKARFKVFFLKGKEKLLKREIKAATYHNFQLFEDEHGYKVRLIFDI